VHLSGEIPEVTGAIGNNRGRPSSGGIGCEISGRRNRADGDLPATAQFRQQFQRFLRITGCKADAVVAEIDINLIALSLNAVNGRREESMFFVAEQRTNSGFPGIGKFVQKFDGRLGCCRSNFDFPLIIRSDRYGSFVFVLRDGDDFVEVNFE
jgi:hypothetical protein